MLRLLRFYDKYDHDFKFIIVDSSSSNFDTKLKPFINRKNFFYRKFDSNIFFISKISKILKFLNTEFAVLCADDDFLIPSGIIESKNFLRSNQDYSSAHGLYFNHTPFIDTNGLNKNFHIGPIHNNPKSSNENSPKERLRRYLLGENGIYPLYAVHRSDTFKLIWKDADNVVSDWGLVEHYPSCLSLIYGKMKILNCFYSSREPNSLTFENADTYKRMYSVQNIKKFKNGLINNFSVVCDLSKDKSKKIILPILDKWYSSEKKKIINRFKVKNSLINRIKNVIRFRTRIYRFLYDGCHPSVYSLFNDDFKLLRESVIESKLGEDEINKSRSEY